MIMSGSMKMLNPTYNFTVILPSHTCRFPDKIATSSIIITYFDIFVKYTSNYYEISKNLV